MICEQGIFNKIGVGMKDFIKRLKFIHILTIILIFIGAAAGFIVLLNPDFKDGESRTQVLTAMLGLLGGAAAYWVGSTSGSNRKTELIAKSSEQKNR